MTEFKAHGRHATVTFRDASLESCTVAEFALICVRQGLDKYKEQIHVLGTKVHYFGEPDSSGYTAVILLSESHATIHTYPETRTIFFDIFTCGEFDQQLDLIQYLTSAFEARFTNYKCFDRN